MRIKIWQYYSIVLHNLSGFVYFAIFEKKISANINRNLFRHLIHLVQIEVFRPPDRTQNIQISPRPEGSGAWRGHPSFIIAVSAALNACFFNPADAFRLSFAPCGVPEAS